MELTNRFQDLDADQQYRQATYFGMKDSSQ